MATTFLSNNSIKNGLKDGFANNSFSGADMLATMHISGTNGLFGTYTLGSLQTLTYSTSMNRSPIRSIGNVNAKDYVMGSRTIAGSLVFAVFNKHFAYDAMAAIKGVDAEEYHFLADELPPFDITITFANEYGKISKMAIYGIRLINEGQVMSINDIYTENTYQYVATDLDYMTDNALNTSKALYTPLKPNPNSISEPVSIADIHIDEDTTNEADIDTQAVIVTTSPASMSNNREIPGMAKLDLFSRTDKGHILVNKVLGDLSLDFELSSGTQFPIPCGNLYQGEYEAYYSYNGTDSDKTIFKITLADQKRYPNPPTVIMETKLQNGTYKVILAPTDQYTDSIEIASNMLGPWTALGQIGKEFVAESLTEYIPCYFRSSNDCGSSSAIKCLVDGKKDLLYEDFYDYVMQNKLLIAKSVSWPAVTAILATLKTAPLNSSIVESLSSIRYRLDLKNEDIKAAYDRLHIVAVEFEGQGRLFQSSGDVLSSPVISDAARNIIKFNLSVNALEITAPNGIKKHIDKNLFSKSLNYYTYQVTGQYKGVYTIVAFDSLGNKSIPLKVTILNQDAVNSYIQEEKQLAAMNDINLSLVAVSDLKTEAAISATDADRKELLYELSNSNNSLKSNIAAPTIIFNGLDKVVIQTEIESFILNYSLCVCPTLKIGSITGVRKYPITSAQETINLYASKNMLVSNTRYAVWIENNDGIVVSPTTGFTYNSNDSKTDTLTANEVVSRVAKSFKYEENKHKTQDFLYESNISATEIYNEVIMADVYETDYSYTMDLIYDAVSAFHASKNASLDPFPEGIVYDAKKETIAYSSWFSKYDEIVVVKYKDKEKNIQTYDFKPELKIPGLNDCDMFYFLYQKEHKAQVTEVAIYSPNMSVGICKTNLEVKL